MITKVIELKISSKLSEPTAYVCSSDMPKPSPMIATLSKVLISFLLSVAKGFCNSNVSKNPSSMAMAPLLIQSNTIPAILTNSIARILSDSAFMKCFFCENR